METLELIRDLNNLLGDPSGLENTFREVSVGIAVIVFLFNSIQCFFGYKLTKLWISISGFFLFGLIGLGIGAASGGSDEAVIIGLVLAIIGAFIAFKLYKIGIFILGFIGGLILGILIFNSISLGAVLGVMLGVLSFILTKPVIIVSTAIPAGMLAGSSLVTIFGSDSRVFGTVLGIIYAIAGIAVQWITNKDVKANARQSGSSISNSSLDKEELQNDEVRKEGDVETPIVDAMSEMARQANNNINDNISKAKQKLKDETIKASKEAKGLNIFEVLSELQLIFYSGKISKYIMLYCEFIMYYLAAQEVIVTYGYIASHTSLSLGISKIGFLIALIIGVLVLSKKKYYSFITYCSITSITSCIKFLYIAKYSFNIEHFVYALIIIGINILVIKLFLETEEGLGFKKKVSTLFSNTVSSNSNSSQNETVKTKIMIRCPKCGELCDEKAKFFQGCGEKIIAINVEDKELNEEMLDYTGVGEK